MSEAGINRDLKQLEWDKGILDNIEMLTAIVEKHGKIIRLLHERIEQLEEGAK